jgi:phage shock protein A
MLVQSVNTSSHLVEVREEVAELKAQNAELKAKVERLNERLWVEKARTAFLLGTKARLTGELKSKNYALAVWRDNAIQQANGK